MGSGNGWHKAARCIPQYRIVSPTTVSSRYSARNLCQDQEYTSVIQKDCLDSALVLIWLHRVDTLVLCPQTDALEKLQQLLDEQRPPGVNVMIVATASKLPQRGA